MEHLVSGLAPSNHFFGSSPQSQLSYGRKREPGHKKTPALIGRSGDLPSEGLYYNRAICEMLENSGELSGDEVKTVRQEAVGAMGRSFWGPPHEGTESISPNSEISVLGRPKREREFQVVR